MRNSPLILEGDCVRYTEDGLVAWCETSKHKPIGLVYTLEEIIYTALILNTQSVEGDQPIILNETNQCFVQFLHALRITILHRERERRDQGTRRGEERREGRTDILQEFDQITQVQHIRVELQIEI